jgi:hypothetical protein
MSVEACDTSAKQHTLVLANTEKRVRYGELLALIGKAGRPVIYLKMAALEACPDMAAMPKLL